MDFGRFWTALYLVHGQSHGQFLLQKENGSPLGKGAIPLRTPTRSDSLRLGESQTQSRSLGQVSGVLENFQTGSNDRRLDRPASLLLHNQVDHHSAFHLTNGCSPIRIVTSRRICSYTRRSTAND